MLHEAKTSRRWPIQTLDMLAPGDRAVVQSVHSADPTLSIKLLSMGVVPGRIVEVSCRAPLGDPISVKVGLSSCGFASSRARPASREADNHRVSDMPSASHLFSLRLSEARSVEVVPEISIDPPYSATLDTATVDTTTLDTATLDTATLGNATLDTFTLGADPVEEVLSLYPSSPVV